MGRVITSIVRVGRWLDHRQRRRAVDDLLRRKQSTDSDEEQPTADSDAGWTEDSADHDVERVVETNDDYEETSSFWNEESEVYDESEDPWTRDQEQQETIVKESYEDEQSTNCPDASPTADSDDVQTDPDAGWTMDSNDEPTSPQSKDSWNKSLLKLDEDYYEDDDWTRMRIKHSLTRVAPGRSLSAQDAGTHNKPDGTHQPTSPDAKGPIKLNSLAAHHKEGEERCRPGLYRTLSLSLSLSLYLYTPIHH